jgi:hypothetical protein
MCIPKEQHNHVQILKCFIDYLTMKVVELVRTDNIIISLHITPKFNKKLSYMRYMTAELIVTINIRVEW